MSDRTHPRWQGIPAAYPGPHVVLDLDRLEQLAARALAALEPERAEWLAALATAAGGIALERFNERGLATIVVLDPLDGGGGHPVTVVHWSSLAPDVTDLDEIVALWP